MDTQRFIQANPYAWPYNGDLRPANTALVVQRPTTSREDLLEAVERLQPQEGTTVGGAIVDSGKFPWGRHKERFARLNEPDPSYHGVVYTEALGPAA